jgi:small subunit ribosomal protein S15
MARMYSRKKGKSGSKKPIVSNAKKWTKLKKAEIEEIIVGMAKERKTSAQIGMALRDGYGVPDVKVAVGKTVSAIMKEGNAYPKFPEDMMSLLRKSVTLRKHLELNKPDKHSKRGLENLESKIRRLGKYYVRTGSMPKGWKYSPEETKLLVQKT